MALGTAGESEKLRQILRSFAPGENGIGDCCEAVRRSPLWMLRAALELAINPKAIPCPPGASPTAARKYFRAHPDLLATIRRLGRGLCELPFARDNGATDRECIEKVYEVIVELRSLGRLGMFALTVFAMLLRAFGMPFEDAPEDASPLQKLKFYGLRLVAYSALLNLCASWWTSTEDYKHLFITRDEKAKTAICNGLREFCRYVRNARSAYDLAKHSLRVATPKPVAHIGIVARDWHDLAIQLAERLLTQCLSAVDSAAPMYLGILETTVVDALMAIDLDDKWPTIATAIAQISDAEPLQLLVLQLECEIEAAGGDSGQSEFIQGITGLSEKHRKAFVLIKSLATPLKGIVLAHKLGISNATFRRHYVPFLRPHGLKNDGDGYYIV